MELSKQELQYLLNSIDTHVKANGLTVAAPGVILAQKIQNAANELPADELPPDENTGKK